MKDSDANATCGPLVIAQVAVRSGVSQTSGSPTVRHESTVGMKYNSSGNAAPASPRRDGLAAAGQLGVSTESGSF